MPPTVPKKSTSRTRSLKKIIEMNGFDVIDNLSLQDKAFAALQLVPSWNATLAYKAVFDPTGERTTDPKLLAYSKNKADGIYGYKMAVAEALTGLKGDASVFPNKLKAIEEREIRNAEKEAANPAPEKPPRDLDLIMADSDKYTKEAILLELSQMAKETSDTGEKIKIFNAISALENMKSVASVDEENMVRYFLPIKCSHCSLHAQAVKDGIIDEND